EARRERGAKRADGPGLKTEDGKTEDRRSSELTICVSAHASISWIQPRRARVPARPQEEQPTRVVRGAARGVRARDLRSYESADRGPRRTLCKGRTGVRRRSQAVHV